MIIAAQSNGGNHIFFVTGNYNADRNLTIVRSISRIEGAAAGVKAHFAAQVAAERGFKRRGVELVGMRGWWSNVLWHRAQNIFSEEDIGRKQRLSAGMSFVFLSALGGGDLCV